MALCYGQHTHLGNLPLQPFLDIQRMLVRAQDLAVRDAAGPRPRQCRSVRDAASPNPLHTSRAAQMMHARRVRAYIPRQSRVFTPALNLLAAPTPHIVIRYPG